MSEPLWQPGARITRGRGRLSSAAAASAAPSETNLWVNGGRRGVVFQGPPTLNSFR